MNQKFSFLSSIKMTLELPTQRYCSQIGSIGSYKGLNFKSYIVAGIEKNVYEFLYEKLGMLKYDQHKKILNSFNGISNKTVGFDHWWKCSINEDIPFKIVDFGMNNGFSRDNGRATNYFHRIPQFFLDGMTPSHIKGKRVVKIRMCGGKIDVWYGGHSICLAMKKMILFNAVLPYTIEKWQELPDYYFLHFEE
jgi:hypothetical protein